MIEIEKQEIKEVYDRWRKALMTNDLDSLDQLFSNDFISIRSKGKCKNKLQELLWLGSENLQYVFWEDQKISINESGDRAFVKCCQSLQVLVYDLPAKIVREIVLTFIKQNKKWQLQQYQEIADGNK